MTSSSNYAKIHKPHSKRGAEIRPKERKEIPRKKFFKKDSKKVLTKGKRYDIIVKLSARAGSENGH